MYLFFPEAALPLVRSFEVEACRASRPCRHASLRLLERSSSSWPRQLAFALFPSGTLDHLLDALRQAVALDAQIVHSDTGRLEQIAATNLCRVDSQFGSHLVKLGFKGKTDINRAMATHGAARRLV